MAQVSKTNPVGVDFVLNALQSYIYPNLVGAGWDDYECYPRANKNNRGENIIAEVAEDPSEYREVLFNDNYNATSFFLVSDIVPIDYTEGLIIQDCSIIFQVKLDKLFSSVTTHRADEELHVLITDLLQNTSIVQDIAGYEVGVENVYSDLSIGDFGGGDEAYDDLSEFHVVKYDFSVRYRTDDCTQTYAPVCSPVNVSLNGVLTTQPNPGDTKAITTVDDQGNPVSVTVNVDTATELEIELPSVPVLTNTATAIKSGFTTSRYGNDDGLLKRGRLIDWFTLDYNNPFGNTDRFTSISGSRYNQNLSQYELLDGTVVTKELAFPLDIIIDWAQWNKVDGEVFAFFHSQDGGFSQPTATGSNWTLNAPYSDDGNLFADWQVIQPMESFMLVNFDTLSGFDWSPLERPIVGTTTQIFTSAHYLSNRTWGWFGTGNAAFSILTTTQAKPSILVRYLTEAQLDIFNPSIPYTFNDTDAENYYNALVTSIGYDVQSLALYYISINELKQAIDTAVQDLKSAGIWSKAKMMFPFIGATAGSHAINMVDGSSILTYYGTVNHVNRGMDTNNSSGATISQSVDSLVSLNDGAMAVWGVDPSGSGVNFVGDPQLTSKIARLGISGVNALFRWGATSQDINLPANDVNKMLIGTKTPTGDIELYNNNVLIGTSTGGVGALPDNPQIFIGSNFNEYVFAGIFDGLTAAEATSLNNIIETLNTTLNRA